MALCGGWVNKTQNDYNPHPEADTDVVKVVISLVQMLSKQRNKGILLYVYAQVLVKVLFHNVG